jgi:WD40 repeat protein
MDNFVALRLASSLLRLLVGTIVALSSVCAQNTSPLHLEKEIPLPGVEGRIDHFSADVQGRRLFIAALENGTVEVIDIRKGERSTEVKGLSEPQGVFYSSQNDELYVASGGDGTLRVYDGTTLKLRQTSEFGADADNVRYDGDIGWARGLADSMRPFSSGAYFLNFLGEEGEDTIKAAFGPNYNRLVSIKKKYDPENFFSLNQNIKPQA